MNTITTKAVVLQRTDYGEADRILVVLTDAHGVQHVLAKGVRKITSKLAGGVELFAINELSIALGKNELRTLISARMHTAYGQILTDIQRTMLGYELLRFLYKQLEHEAGPEYFAAITQALAGLHDTAMDPALVELWFYLHFAALSGLQPDLTHDVAGQRLQPNQSYGYVPDEGRLQVSPHGILSGDHIKLVRFLLAQPLAAARRLRVDAAIISGCGSFIRPIKQTG